ncbi:TPA: hypothetical protein DIC39_01705 [Patescibacteria group bacterium]|nr:hypothetical protein [Patescibacteria group bacterium]
MEAPVTHSKTVRLLFFWSGIIATLAYRVIVVLNGWSPMYVQIAWYIGTVGFVVYFIHRYQISERRRRIIHQHQLAAKVPSLQELSADDKAAMNYIFSTLESSKEKWNNIFIFITSALALAYGLIADFTTWLD